MNNFAFLLSKDMHRKLETITYMMGAHHPATALSYAIDLTLSLMVAMGEKEEITVTIFHPTSEKGNKHE